MFVSRSMTRKVITVDPEQSVFEAQELMADHKIRHLPVIDANQQVVGIVTDRDIRSALPFNFIKDSCSAEQRDHICALTVKDIMTTDLVPKAANASLKLNGKTVRLGGIAKGSGMIAPNLATMQPARIVPELRPYHGDAGSSNWITSTPAALSLATSSGYLAIAPIGPE